MKVCYILPYFYPHVGGGEQAFLDLLQELSKKEELQIRVITSSDKTNKSFQKYKGIDIYYYNWKIFCGHPIVRKEDLKEHIKWADIVHCGVYTPVRKACSIVRKHNKPSVVTAHEVLGKRWFWIEKNIFKALAFYIYERYIVHTKCDYYHTPSHATETDLKRCNKKAKVKNIYWIVDENKKEININKQKFNDYFGITDKDIVFLNYGRPGKTKGVFIYLDAIKDVINELKEEQVKNIKFCFIMAKDPKQEREKFIKKVKEYNLKQYVVVKESVPREDLENYIMCATYVVVPSITEGFGLSAIEACNMGKKLIHSTGGSLPEVTFGEVIEFKNRDSKDLKDKLKKVITGDIEFEHKQRKDFSKEKITSEMLELYNEILSK